MKRWVLAVVGVLVLAGLVRFGAFAVQRRSDRASHTLARELGRLSDVPRPRVPHVTPPTAGRTAQGYAGLFDARAEDFPQLTRILLATRAAEGGLPPGLAPESVGPDGWAAAHAVAEELDGLFSAELAALAAGHASTDAAGVLAQCADAFALGRDFAAYGALDGVLAAHEVTVRAFPNCARALDLAPVEAKRAAAAAVGTVVASAPALPEVLREADLAGQLRVFGAWMRPVDLATLSPAAQALARTGPPPPAGFFAHQRAVSVWLGLSKSTHQAMDLLALAPAERDEQLAALEDKVQSPLATALGVRLRWREALKAEDERLAVLRLFALAARLDVGRAEGNAWPALTDVEQGDVEAAPRGDALRLTARGTRWFVDLHPDAAR